MWLEESAETPLLPGGRSAAPAPPHRLLSPFTLLSLTLSLLLLCLVLFDPLKALRLSERQWLRASSTVLSSQSSPSTSDAEVEAPVQAEEVEDAEAETTSLLPLSPAVRETAWILTALMDAAPLLSSRTLVHLSRSLQSVATTLLSVRPSIQRTMWLSDCSSYLPCPYPNSEILREKPHTQSDSDVHQWLRQPQQSHGSDSFPPLPLSPLP